MNQKGSTLLIVIGLVVVLLIGGAITYSTLSGGSTTAQKICQQNGFSTGRDKINQCNSNETAVGNYCCSASGGNVVGGTNEGRPGNSGGVSGETSGNSAGSGGGSISSSWCLANKGTIETFKGRQACHLSTLSGEVYIYIIDKDYWVIHQAYNYEDHFVNGKATELNCLSENLDLLAACEQFKTIYCPTCP